MSRLASVGTSVKASAAPRYCLPLPCLTSNLVLIAVPVASNLACVHSPFKSCSSRSHSGCEDNSHPSNASVSAISLPTL
eukprot:CAMPEP_0181339942 /NCGR_PEP_ID=MMETSP1101-20121128/29560_1 /TAXON_ID=46948 /ORGANISM="Rhodomonas abbreviata, Strain Caron Lab Isolate" /LENGTH=78 /DNA_ID=CAMNT_0023451015 /DNA_START=45 /DNA_END=278 /DNA_ORIENTATION=-